MHQIDADYDSVAVLMALLLYSIELAAVADSIVVDNPNVCAQIRSSP